MQPWPSGQAGPGGYAVERSRRNAGLGAMVLGVGWLLLAGFAGLFALLWAWALENDDDDLVSTRGLAIVLLPAVLVAVGGLVTAVAGGSFRSGEPAAVGRLRRTSLLWVVLSVVAALAVVGHLLTTDDGMDSGERVVVLVLAANGAAFWAIARASSGHG
jgi:hypothetical protein